MNCWPFQKQTEALPTTKNFLKKVSPTPRKTGKLPESRSRSGKRETTQLLSAPVAAQAGSQEEFSL
jgi:hypothetical protein